MLAALHAQSEAIGTHLDLPVATTETMAVLTEFARDANNYFDTDRGRLAPYRLRSAELLSRGLERYLSLIQSNPKWIVHGDSHVNNMYLVADGSAGFVDWQTVGRGHWVHDIGYFMVTALAIEDRREWERTLIEAYIDEWRRRDPSGPGFDEAWPLYKLSLFYPFIVWLGNSDTMQPPDVNWACFERALGGNDRPRRLRRPWHRLTC